jgi:hypothetical protein
VADRLPKDGEAPPRHFSRPFQGPRYPFFYLAGSGETQALYPYRQWRDRPMAREANQTKV